LNWGIALRQTGDFESGLEVLRAAAKSADTSTDVHYQLGFTLFRLGRLEEAERELRHSISLQPNNGQAYYILGRTLEQRGNHAESAKAFAEVERLHRSSVAYAQAVTQYNQGMQALENGDLNAACTAFHAALAFWPDSAQAHTNLGGALLKLGDVKSAVAQFRSAIDLNPDDARAYFDLSLALARSGDRDGADRALERARKLDPEITASGDSGPP